MVSEGLRQKKPDISKIYTTRRFESRYKKDGRYFLIELKLNNIRQLFNSLDPSPFCEKDIDQDAERYIVDTVKSFHLKTPLRIVVYLPQEAIAEGAMIIPDALYHYFDYLAGITQKEFVYCMRQGRTSLFIGLSFLVVCISLQRLVLNLGDNSFWPIIAEGLNICGWVAMWRPIQVFLYEWWAVLRMRRVYEKIRDMKIEVTLDS